MMVREWPVAGEGQLDCTRNFGEAMKAYQGAESREVAGLFSECAASDPPHLIGSSSRRIPGGAPRTSQAPYA